MPRPPKDHTSRGLRAQRPPHARLAFRPWDFLELVHPRSLCTSEPSRTGHGQSPSQPSEPTPSRVLRPLWESATSSSKQWKLSCSRFCGPQSKPGVPRPCSLQGPGRVPPAPPPPLLGCQASLGLRPRHSTSASFVPVSQGPLHLPLRTAATGVRATSIQICKDAVPSPRHRQSLHLDRHSDSAHSPCRSGSPGKGRLCHHLPRTDLGAGRRGLRGQVC